MEIFLLKILVQKSWSVKFVSVPPNPAPSLRQWKARAKRITGYVSGARQEFLFEHQHDSIQTSPNITSDCGPHALICWVYGIARNSGVHSEIGSSIIYRRFHVCFVHRPYTFLSFMRLEVEAADCFIFDSSHRRRLVINIGGQTKIWGKAAILGVGGRVPRILGWGGSQGWESQGGRWGRKLLYRIVYR